MRNAIIAYFKYSRKLKLLFRLRGSVLLASSDEEKLKLYTIFGKLYDLRSSVAHSGTLKEKDTKMIEKEFNNYSELAENICKVLIINGNPDWDKMILGIST